MQRLTIFLGSPTYSLSVVLFSLLLASGLGSYLTRNVTFVGRLQPAFARLVLLVLLLVVFGFVTPRITSLFQSTATPVRILIAVGILFPIGLFMGMAFPLGMKLASVRSLSLTPWLWGINGATSVSASVVAVAVALTAGISASFWIGCLSYIGAVFSFVWMSRETHELAEEMAPEHVSALAQHH